MKTTKVKSIEIKKSQLKEIKKGHYAVEVSDLGFKPGEWPSSLIMENEQFVQFRKFFGNTTANDITYHELKGIVYMSYGADKQITVFND